MTVIFKILEIVRGFGETEKLITNIFELCGEIRAPASLEQVALSRSWLVWSDQLTQFIGKTQNYRLEGAKPFAVAALHTLLAQNGTLLNTHFKSQNVNWENRKKTTTSQNLLTSLRDGYKNNFISQKNTRRTNLPRLLFSLKYSDKTLAIQVKNEEMALYLTVLFFKGGGSYIIFKNFQNQLFDQIYLFVILKLCEYV